MGEYVTKHVPKYIFIHTPTPIHLALASGLMQARLDEQLPQRFVAEVDVVVQG